jgi:hypothetical protein
MKTIIFLTVVLIAVRYLFRRLNTPHAGFYCSEQPRHRDVEALTSLKWTKRQ